MDLKPCNVILAQGTATAAGGASPEPGESSRRSRHTSLTTSKCSKKCTSMNCCCYICKFQTISNITIMITLHHVLNSCTLPIFHCGKHCTVSTVTDRKINMYLFILHKWIAFLLWQDSCSSCKKMAVKMASMQTASEASERTIKNLKDVIALHDKKPTDWTQQQWSTVDLQKT